MCYETSKIRLSVTDHTFYPQREGSPPGGGDAGAERTAELLGRGVAHQVDRSYQLEDGTPVLEVRKQYNNYPAGDYLK